MHALLQNPRRLNRLGELDEFQQNSNVESRAQEGDTDVATAVATTAGRDAMLRHTVQECIRAAASSRDISSVPSRELVCGVAAALGVPEKRTVTIVHAVHPPSFFCSVMHLFLCPDRHKKVLFAFADQARERPVLSV